MEIADYFCTKTKPFRYPRSYFARVEEREDVILTEPEKERMPDLGLGKSMEERQAIMREYMAKYGIQTIADNGPLIHALEAIEQAAQAGSWRFSTGMLRELLPPMKKDVERAWMQDMLIELDVLFHCYRVVVWGARSLPKRIEDKLNFISMDREAPLTDRCWTFVEYASTILQDETVTSSLFVSREGYTEELYADSLYSALVYQMLLHLAAGVDGLDGYSLAECQSCHQTFKKRHGNQKFCPQCSRNSERVRAYKARKKEEAGHGNHP